MSFYQKYRPQRFSQLVNQDHIKKTLLSALKRDKVAHAYLFAGPRGTGKTSTARLLAKAVNCTLRQARAEPCNKCLSCKEFTSLKSLDLIEIDAASNRGIDEIRELREKIQFAPASSSYKVFIVDEVHMLTKEAFNALLKTLEEPPIHAIFILATTEPHKVPATILSRCQRFDFLPLSILDMVGELKRIAKKEKLKYDPLALQMIAASASGSLRDAISILDQLSASREKIKKEKVQRILGIVPERAIIKLFANLVNNQTEEGLKLIQALEARGYNIANFGSEFILFMQKIMIYKATLEEKILADFSKENLQKIKELCQKTAFSKIILMIKKILKYQEIKGDQFPSLGLEMAILELGNTRTLEHKNIKTNEKKLPENKKSIDKKEWKKIVEKIKNQNHSLSAVLGSAQIIKIFKREIILKVKFPFHQERINEYKNRQIIEEAIEEISGKKYFIKCQIEAKKAKKSLKDMAMEVFGS